MKLICCNIPENVFMNLCEKVIKKTFFLFIFLCLAQQAFPEVKSVTSKTDTNQIRIGEQFHLHLIAVVSPGTKINFPFIPDTFNNFELVSRGALDTLSSKDSKELTLRQQLTLTSFDSGYFVIPPFYFTQSNGSLAPDSFSTEALLMTVKTVPVDTTKEIKSIKNIIDVPFPWKDYFLYTLVALAVIGLAIYLFKKFRKREKVIPVPVIPDRPAHEIALEELKRIDSEKLWQQGFTKRYYSEITDVLRTYIERRFSIHAMEQTTDEILRHFNASLIRKEEKEKLGYILNQADMVKFAKAHPLPPENEASMSYAIEFVNYSRPVIKQDFEKAEEAQ